MAFTHGMNIEQIRRIGRELQNVGNNDITRVITTVDRLVRDADTNWEGPDSKRFEQEWNGQYKGQLNRIKQEIVQYGQKAITEAAAQESTSR